VAAALRARYTVEIEPTLGAAHRGRAYPNHRQVRRVADRPDKGILSATASLFHRPRCPDQSSRSVAAEKPLREASCKPFRQKKPTLSQEEALLIANVRRGNGKGFSVGDRRGSSKPTAPVTAEFTKMLSLYLEPSSLAHGVPWNGWHGACQINQPPTTAKCLVDMLVAMAVAYQLEHTPDRPS